MNWYEHHIGDFSKKCAHLSAIEEGIYRRLMDWCYAHERPLPLAMKDVQRCARASTPAERKAVERVLAEFFLLQPDGWHQSRIDRVVSEFKKRVPVSVEAKAASNERKRRSRERRASLFEALRNAGLSPSWNATNRELLEMFEQNDVTVPVTAPVTGTGHGMESRDSAGTGHGSHFPIGGSRDRSPPSAAVTEATARAACADPDARASSAGKACKAMRRAGLSETNPSDPRLLALLDAGATDDELANAAAEASARHKGWAWVLATVAGRRRDAAEMAQQDLKTAPGDANADKVAQWVPSLALRAPSAS